jgi:nitroreductase
MRDAPEPSDRAAAIAAVEHALTTRRAVRAFLPDPIEAAVIARILAVASHAPSGSNIQPWSVHVATGAPLKRLTEALTAEFRSGAPERPGFDYYPTTWRSPYVERRRETGWGLYRLAGVAKGDRAAGDRQRARNYAFFGAPVGLVFAIDADLNRGSWVDNGMLMQSVMVLARAHGLHSCPLAAIGNYPDIVRRHLGIPETQIVIAGMALGHADTGDPTNRLVTGREPVERFVTFHRDDPRADPFPANEG